MQYYTIGQIHRLGLLKNHKGEPYTAKATVSKELKGQPYTVKRTPFGEAKAFSQSVVDSLNDRWTLNLNQKDSEGEKTTTRQR